MDLLSGTTILSLNHFLLGPLAAQVLGDLGADVIAVEPPNGSFSRKWAGGDLWVGETSVFFLCAHRNKRSVVVDLKTGEGRAVVRRLIAGADVLMENFRPGVLDRMGLGFEDAKTINPSLIYASGSGWGSSGPYAAKPGQDLLMQAFCGMAQTSGREAPTAAGASIVDHHGAMVFATAVLAALVARTRDGKGRRVEIDLMSAALDLQVEPLVAYFNGGQGRSIRPPGQVAGWSYPAPYGIYPAMDGHLAISLGPMDKMATVLKDPRLTEFTDEDCWNKRTEVSELFRQYTARRTVADIVDAFEAAGLWAAPVNDFNTLGEDPQIEHLGVFEDVELEDGMSVRLVRHPASYDGVRPGTRLPPPKLGADTDTVLGEFGFTGDEIAELRGKGCVA
ncbi:MAG: CoA transferase [Hyphomicrobiales bacterium]|nr:CoA transferase [Hyphomicrobiales bacterium]